MRILYLLFYILSLFSGDCKIIHFLWSILYSFNSFLTRQYCFQCCSFLLHFFLHTSSTVLVVKACSKSKFKYSKGKKCHTYKIPLRGNSWLHCQLLFLKYNYHIISDNVAFCAVEHFVYARVWQINYLSQLFNMHEPNLHSWLLQSLTTGLWSVPVVRGKAWIRWSTNI